MRILPSIVLALSLSSSVFAADTNKPFERGALSPLQANAWNAFINAESAVFGCEYNDDPRIEEDAQGLVSDILNGKDIEPVRVTYRTLLNMGPNTREILSRNMLVASMECNNVYYTGAELIGVPVIPFEEAITILHDDLANYDDADRIIALRDTFVVAGIDPRWFWAYFIADKAHLDLLGFDYDVLLGVEKAVNGLKGTRSYNDNSFTLLSNIHYGLNHHAVQFYSNSGKCEQTSAEPSKELMVWPELTDSAIKAFYDYHRVAYEGKWKTKKKIDDGAITLYQEEPVDNPVIPNFNVSRGLTISSVECSQ
jgi:hypothetical protein